MKTIIIRKARKRDMPSVLALIHELATFEKARHEVKVTLAELERDGFGKKKAYNCFVAETSDTKIVGMALYFFKYSTWKGRCVYLDDIIVTTSMRRKGIGKKLFDEVIAVAKKMKVRKLEWQVLHWNKPAINFYKKYSTVFDNEWINCKLVFE
ncbi:MAG: GNAT family N-acetyltransferase [Bacteroidetes bacterium]|nr:GNAT family N-acetyltransferase [Bacteroidota bacterium]